MAASKNINEGDIVPLLYNDQSVEAEVYKIKQDKILLRHQEWEWIQKDSARLFPTSDMIKTTEFEDESDDDLFFALNTENSSSNDEENSGTKYDKKNKRLGNYYKYANGAEAHLSSEHAIDENVTLEDIYSCIKVLKKIKKFPQILNTPLFNPIHSHLRQISDISNASASQLYQSIPINNKKTRQLRRDNDNKLKMKSGIRVARQQRATKAEKWRHFLNAQERTEPAINEISTIQNSTIDSDCDMHIDDNRDNVAVLRIDNNSDTRESIEVHGQILTTCAASELQEVLHFIKMNAVTSTTTPFERGTIICDEDDTQRLDLCKQQLGPRNTSLITAAMRTNDTISALLLGANGIGNDGAKCIADLIQNGSNKLSTIFLGCNLIKTKGIQALCQSLHQNKTVKGLWLKRNPIGVEGSKHVANMLANNECLRTLDLVSTGIGEEGIEHIVNGLISNAKHSALQRIYLCALNIYHVSFINKTLSCMFMQCVHLKEIFLSSNNIGDLGAIELSKVLLVCPQIEILSLQSCNIGDDGAISLGWVLTSHPNLMYLDFGYAVNTKPTGNEANKITDRSAFVFAQIFSVLFSSKNPSKFERLSLVSNQITDIGARSLFSVLQNENKNGDKHQIVQCSLIGNRNIENKMIISYIAKICNENAKWKQAQKQSNDDGEDIKVRKTGNKNMIDVNISDELRNKRMLTQNIHPNLGEIRSNTNKILSGGEYDTCCIRSVYRNPKQKQFCPQLVKDGENDGAVLDQLSLKELIQCHGTGSTPHLSTNSKDEEKEHSANPQFIIRKTPNKKRIRSRLKNQNNDNHNTPINNGTDAFTQHPAIECAPRLSADQQLPQSFVCNDDEAGQTLNFSRKCYVCKSAFRKLHFFYDAMCSDCGDYNFYQRFDCRSCKDKIAIVTGGRIKIGYEIVLKLLRAQCTVMVTTRFPRYAAIKYAKEKDFDTFKDRLSIFGVDFCRLQSVDKFIKYVLKHYKHIDFLINNAASTVRRTQEFYAEILKTEKQALPLYVPKQLVIEYEHFTEAQQVSVPLALEMDQKKCIELEHEDDNVMNKVLSDIGHYDEHCQPIDLRHNNSWTAMIGAIHPLEAMEVIMVNQFVPFLFINQLIPLLSNKGNINNNNNNDLCSTSYIINVSAMEGRFHFIKQGTHPHTNMAKAALNMLTRTSAAKLAQRHNIFMVSVDTGWVTDELPLKRRIKSQMFQRKQQDVLHVDAQKDKNDFIFHPPLDEIDGASRVLHPIWSGLRGKAFIGVFLKDYRRIDW